MVILDRILGLPALVYLGVNQFWKSRPSQFIPAKVDFQRRSGPTSQFEIWNSVQRMLACSPQHSP
jgi:hypothetical protein